MSEAINILESVPSTTYDSVEKILVTPEMAEQWLGADLRYRHQRNLSKKHVQELAGKLTAGDLTPGNDVVFAGITGSEKKVHADGQHTLHAIILSGMPCELTLKKFSCVDETALGELYFRLDNPQKRGASHVLSVKQFAERFDIPPTSVTFISAGTGMIYLFLDRGEKTTGEKFGNDARADMGEMWMQYGKQFLELMGNSANKALFTRAAVIAAGMWTIRYSPEAAADFWGGIRDDNGLLAKSPQKTLLEWMKKTAAAGSASHGKSAPNFVHLKAVNNAWNAYVENREMHHIKIFPGSAKQYNFLTWTN